MTNKCKYYDAELDCCKQLSDWTEPMPILQPCVDAPCCFIYEELCAKKGGADNG
jgi:hypothetical protein